MKRGQRRLAFGRAILTASVFVFLLAMPARAQYTANYQTNIISGVTRNWTGNYYVGYTNFADALLIQSSGVLSNGSGYLGYSSSGNNSVLVSDSGSVWSNAFTYGLFDVYVGNSGAGNSLTISNGGRVVNRSSVVGYNASSSNNSVLVSGTGSWWKNSDTFYLGYAGAGNSLVISNGGRVSNSASGTYIGYGTSSGDNTVLVTGLGSVWTNGFTPLVIGASGARNTLVVRNGGVVSGGETCIGSNASATGNSVLVTDPNTVLSNRFNLTVGYDGAGNSLVVSNGAKVVGAFYNSYVGVRPGSSNNTVVVKGLGSVWTTPGSLGIGGSGASNSLVVRDGGIVVSANGGFGGGTNGNSALISDPGSVWTNSGCMGVGGSLTISNAAKVFCSCVFYGGIGDSNDMLVVTGSNSVLSIGGTFECGGAGNQFVISDGGQVFNGDGFVGRWTFSHQNHILVTDSASVWSNRGSLYVGYYGSGNSLTISNGASVFSAFGQLGESGGGGSNTVCVTGGGSSWVTHSVVVVGLYDYGGNNRLTIDNGGRVVCQAGQSYVGYYSGNNHALVTGPDSVWSVASNLFVGYSGWNPPLLGCSLTISNGGKVVSQNGFVGYGTSNSTVWVTGSGSVWSNQAELYIAGSGELVVGSGGLVVNSTGYLIGFGNRVRVTDGSSWRNDSLYVGQGIGINEMSNSLIVAGGTVFATNLIVGVYISGTCSTNRQNVLQLDSGSVIVTNATMNAVLEVRFGKLILNGGLLQVDRFVMTNTCAQFVRTGGTLIYGTAVLTPTRDDDGDGMLNGWEQAYGLDPLNAADSNTDPDGDGFTNLQEFQAGTDPTNSASAFRITDIVQEGDDILVTWMMGSNKTNALEATAGDVSGGFTNAFADIFTVTNTVGSVTNYLDAGAATNTPSRYYRIHLVP